MPTNASRTKSRAPNFLPEEDKQLARSWAHISQDVVRSNDQGKEEFFARVTKEFNKFTPGPQRDSQGLQNRWKHLQKLVLTFCALYQHIEDNPASGSSPSDWLADAKHAYFEKEGKQFIYEHAWSFLKTLAKFQNVAKNGRRQTGTSNVVSVASSPTPTPGRTDNSEPTKSQTVGRNATTTSWTRPPGVRAEKRKIEESDFQRKKLKLLKKANAETALRIAEARRANDIQEKLAQIDQNESDQHFMMQDLDDCPDEESRQFFCER